MINHVRKHACSSSYLQLSTWWIHVMLSWTYKFCSITFTMHNYIICVSVGLYHIHCQKHVYTYPRTCIFVIVQATPWCPFSEFTYISYLCTAFMTVSHWVCISVGNCVDIFNSVIFFCLSQQDCATKSVHMSTFVHTTSSRPLAEFI